MSDGRHFPRVKVRLSTAWRLVAAFSAVLAAFVSSLVYQDAGLRRMEATFDAMRAHEEQMRLALQLEDAVRDQYGHAGRVALGDAAGLHEYEDARARALELDRQMTERIDEPDAIAWMIQIREATAELDRMFREQIAPGSPGGRGTAVVAHEDSYPLVSLIEGNVDRIFARLQQATTQFRHELVRVHEGAERTTALLLVAGPVLVALAALYLARSVARPLAKLGAGAAAIASGDLDTRIDIVSRDEFGELAGEFNAMTAALKAHQARLVESEKLAGIGRLAAGVAHELNNPLQVMLGFLSVHRDAKDPRLAKHLALAEREVLRCVEIIDDLLELSRGAPAPARVDLRALCESVAEALRTAMSPEGVRLTVDGHATALGDGPKLRQVAFNLVKNAVEASGPGGEVHVVVRAAGDTAEVTVRDSGPGIPAGARPRLFEPFFTTKRSGKGLGLAVSRAIALAHGGDIETENGATRGAVFTLRLPRAPEART
jgi:signal transduction histidine kinase